MTSHNILQYDTSWYDTGVRHINRGRTVAWRTLIQENDTCPARRNHAFTTGQSSILKLFGINVLWWDGMGCDGVGCSSERDRLLHWPPFLSLFFSFILSHHASPYHVRSYYMMSYHVVTYHTVLSLIILYSTALHYTILCCVVQVLARSSPDDKHILVCRLNGHALPSNEQDWLLAHPGCDWKDRDNILPGYLQEWQQARSASGTERYTLHTAHCLQTHCSQHIIYSTVWSTHLGKGLYGS